MLLGVPVLKRYDLLERLLASAEATYKLDGYLIVDNGGEFRAKLEGSPVIHHALSNGRTVRVLEPGSNIGVAAAWNAILDEAAEDLVVISNDDVELGETTLQDLVGQYEGTRALASTESDSFRQRALMTPLVIADGGLDASGWCLFLHSPELYQKIGPYDESFYPAYYEDSDYRWRMKLGGIEPVLVKTEFKHAVRGSWSDESQKQIRRGLEQFERKWGGDPRGDESLLFRTPFDGAPIAYSLRKRTHRGMWRTLVRKIYRWDVINAIASRIDAKSYLEIGIGSGETLRKVDIRWKEGVDPAPAVEGPSAANVFYRCSSDAFFDGFAVKPYDITFVDGLHHSEQAYQDIESACNISRVVVVHDANPSTEAMQAVPQVQGEWTGDVWKAIVRIRREGNHMVRTVDADYGVAIVIPNRSDDGIPSLPAETYTDLVTHRKELLGLVSFDEMLEWFKERGNQ